MDRSLSDETYDARESQQDNHESGIDGSDTNTVSEKPADAGDAGDADQETNELIDERASTHGDIHETFPAIARAWEAYLGGTHDSDIYLSADNVADMMVLLKLMRKAGGQYHPDHYDDAQAYAEIGDRLAQEM